MMGIETKGHHPNRFHIDHRQKKISHRPGKSTHVMFITRRLLGRREYVHAESTPSSKKIEPVKENEETAHQ
jgi:hypothetical protein